MRPAADMEQTMNSRSLSLTAVAAVLIAGGAMVAVAQDAPARDDGPAADPRLELAQLRDGRGHRGGGRADFGRGGRGMVPALFREADDDGDGSLTQAEIDAYVGAELQAADTDADGAVDLEEFAPAYFERMRPRMVDAFQAFDRDGSGAIESAELDERFGGLVDRLDRDGDDALTPQDGRRGRD